MGNLVTKTANSSFAAHLMTFHSEDYLSELTGFNIDFMSRGEARSL